MKHRFLIVVFAVSAMAATYAQQPIPTALKTEKPEMSANSGLSAVYTDGKCHFRFKAVTGQRYDSGMYMFDPTKDTPVGWGFGIGCHAGASQDDIDGFLAAKQVNGTWIWEGTNQPFTPEQHFKTDQFTGKNWTGTAIIYDDTTGDEDHRGRNLFFCLIETHGPQVLCGEPLSVRAVLDPPSVSTLPKIMAVLKTIEFVDQPANPPTSSSASVGH